MKQEIKTTEAIFPMPVLMISTYMVMLISTHLKQ